MMTVNMYMIGYDISLQVFINENQRWDRGEHNELAHLKPERALLGLAFWDMTTLYSLGFPIPFTALKVRVFLQK